MDFLVKNLIEQYKPFSNKRILHRKKYSIPAIVLCLLSILIDIIIVVKRNTISSLLAGILLLVSILMLIIAEILLIIGNHEYCSKDMDANMQKEKLHKTMQMLEKNDFVHISNKEDIITIKDVVSKYYNNKFKTLLSLKQYTNAIFKVMLIPILLAIINYVLNNTDSVYFISKIIYIILIFICVLTLMLIVYLSFDILKLIIEIINADCELLLDDLEFLSCFNIQNGVPANTDKCTESSET